MSPDLVSTCLQELVIRIFVAAALSISRMCHRILTSKMYRKRQFTPAFFEKKQTMPPFHVPAPTSATCVCHPLFLRVPLFFSTTIAGGMAAVSLAMPTKLWDSAGRECGRTFLYLQPELFFTRSNVIGLLSWFFMLPPPNRFSRRCAVASTCACCNTFVKQYFSADSCAFPFLHLPSRRGN